MKRKVVFISRLNVWKLKDTDVQKRFQEKVESEVMERKEEDVESVWKGLRDCLLQMREEVCGRTKGPPRHKETGWWTDDVSKAVNEKMRLYKVRCESKVKEDKERYHLTRNSAKEVAYRAQEGEREFGDMEE